MRPCLWRYRAWVLIYSCNFCPQFCEEIACSAVLDWHCTRMSITDTYLAAAYAFVLVHDPAAFDDEQLTGDKVAVGAG